MNSTRYSKIDQSRKTTATTLRPSPRWIHSSSAPKRLFSESRNGDMKMTFVGFSIDQECLQICIDSLIETAGPLTDEDAIQTLAMAQIYEVPILPNNEHSREKLLELYSQLYEYGFEADYEGKKRRFKLTEKAGAPRSGFDDENSLNQLICHKLALLRWLSPPEGWPSDGMQTSERPSAFLTKSRLRSRRSAAC